MHEVSDHLIVLLNRAKNLLLADGEGSSIDPTASNPRAVDMALGMHCGGGLQLRLQSAHPTST